MLHRTRWLEERVAGSYPIAPKAQSVNFDGSSFQAIDSTWADFANRQI
jgi:hypothetical protein